MTWGTLLRWTPRWFVEMEPLRRSVLVMILSGVTFVFSALSLAIVAVHDYQPPQPPHVQVVDGGTGKPCTETRPNNWICP